MEQVRQRYVQKFPLADLVPDELNPWAGDDESVGESIDSLGFYGAVLVQKSTGRLIAGHTRRRKALADGAVTIPALVLDVDDDTARRILVRDNNPGKGQFVDEPLRNVLAMLRDTDRGLAGVGFGDDDLAAVVKRLERDARATHTRKVISAEVPEGAAVTATWHIGDTLSVLRTLPDASVDLVLTSPPFLALRSYLPADHPDKAAEMGSEPTPGQFLDALLDVVVECRRVLAPHGSLCVELGDTYANDNGDYTSRAAAAFLEAKGRTSTLVGVKRANGAWPLAKSLCLIPEAFRFALAYGRNPHTGRTIVPWRVRNVVRWCRPNPPVGALGDKVRPATSDIAIACTSAKRYFDLDAVREPGTSFDRNGETKGRLRSATEAPEVGSGWMDGKPLTHNPAGAPPLDHWWHNDTDVFDQDAWLISTEPYAGSHYATFPRALCIKPILAMCPQKVCTICGKPSERIVEATYEPRSANRTAQPKAVGPNGERLNRPQGMDLGESDKHVRTVGWSDCGHNTWRNGVVLDCFAGSGTTGAVAVSHGRSFIGIDIDARNADFAVERIGSWLVIVGENVKVAEVEGPVV